MDSELRELSESETHEITDRISVDILKHAVSHLQSTDRGRAAVRHVLRWLDEGGIGLDEAGQAAILTLLDGAWGPYAGTARDLMRGAIDKGGEK